MKQLLPVAMVLFLVTFAFAQLPTISQVVPESVVRIYVNENKDQAPDVYGSGVLISPTQVLTNWHVVKDRRKDRRKNNRAIQVRFADGSRRFAIVVRQDSIWDVALLSIHKTDMTPITVGSRPKTGEEITIQGLGPDYEYKPQTGILSDIEMYPESQPNNLDYVQILKVRARQGDSGGPLTDAQGNLVGLLYGASNFDQRPYTYGTLIDRIQKVFGAKMKPSRYAEADNDGNDYILRGKEQDGKKQQLRNDPMGTFRPPKTNYWAPNHRILQSTRNN